MNLKLLPYKAYIMVSFKYFIQIALNFCVPDNQIVFHLWEPNYQIVLHFCVPNNLAALYFRVPDNQITLCICVPKS